jgi:hypothetical protein
MIILTLICFPDRHTKRRGTYLVVIDQEEKEAPQISRSQANRERRKNQSRAHTEHHHITITRIKRILIIIMGVCLSQTQDTAASDGRPAARYRQQSVIDEELARAMELLYPDDEAAELETSDGRLTTENQFLTSVRVAAAKVQSRIVHGINDDAEQFSEPFQHPDTLLSHPQKKFMHAWVDDQLQQALRAHLLERLPKSYQLKPIPSFATTSSTTNQQQRPCDDHTSHTNNSSTSSYVYGFHEGSDHMAPLSPDKTVATGVSEETGGGSPNMPLQRTPPPPITLHPPPEDSTDENWATPVIELAGGATIKNSRRPEPILVAPLSPQLHARTAPPTTAAAIPISTGDEGCILTPTSPIGSEFALAPTSTCNSHPQIWNGAGALVLTEVVDVDLIIRVVNDYCRPPSSLQRGEEGKRHINRRLKTVTLGDPLSAFARGVGGGAKSGQNKKSPEPNRDELQQNAGAPVELNVEFVEMTSHMRILDPPRRHTSNSHLQSTHSNGSATMQPANSFLSDVASPSFLNSNMSIFSEGSARMPMEDLSDPGEPSLLSPLSGVSSSLVDMSSSPYAAHGCPWKERTLNTETLKVHNKLVSIKEKQLYQQYQQMSKTAQDVERRPKVLMQLLFGALVMQAYWSTTNRQLFGHMGTNGGSDEGSAGGLLDE